MFKRMLAAFGVGGPSVDTVLDSDHARPGHLITGHVRIQGGTNDADIDRIDLSLVTAAEVEFGDHEAHGAAELRRDTVADGIHVPATQQRDIPFQLVLPWETPITTVDGAPLRGMIIGIRTDLTISGAPDKGDLDPLIVPPLPSQTAVLAALAGMGFRTRGADVEIGRLPGIPHELACYQEIEYLPPAHLASRIAEVELTFVATSRDLYVILEADKRRGGHLRPAGDDFGRFAMPHDDAEHTDWTGLIDDWLIETANRRPAGAHHQPAYGRDGDHHEHRGPGMGTILAAGAGGLAGGIILGEVAEEVFEGDDGDEGDDGE